jgi:hypothetical protein
MKVLMINQKTALVRKWFKWYVVRRSGSECEAFKPETNKAYKPSIKDINKSLATEKKL